MDRRVLCALVFIVLASAIVSESMLDRGHNWGDDFAQYIMQAQAVSGRWLDEYIQMSTFTVEESNSSAFGVVTVPWGFPLMLAPVDAFVGTKLLAFKLVNTISYLLFLVVYFFLARMRLSPAESLLLTAVLAFSPTLLRGQNEILPDIPFLLFSTLGLLLIELHVSEEISSRFGVLLAVMLGFVIFAGAWTRPNGFLLLVPLAVAQRLYFRRRPGAPTTRPALDTATFMIPYVVAGCFYSLQAVVLPTTGNVFQTPILKIVGSSVTPNPDLFNAWPGIWANLSYYFWLPSEILRYTLLAGARGIPAYVFLLAFAALGALKGFVRNAPMILYAVSTLGLFVVSGGQQGLRYVYPILPILVLFAFVGMKTAANRFEAPLRNAARLLVYAVWMGLAMSSVVTTASWAWLNLSSNRTPPGTSSGAYSQGSTRMFDFVRQHTPEDSIIIFFKPRLMRLRTHRNSFMTQTCENLRKGTYLVSVKDGGANYQIAPDKLHKCESIVTLSPVYDEDDWIVYQISPAP